MPCSTRSSPTPASRSPACAAPASRSTWRWACACGCARAADALPDLRRYLDLVALGTIADMVPMVEENRVLVKYGLRELAASGQPGHRGAARRSAA